MRIQAHIQLFVARLIRNFRIRIDSIRAAWSLIAYLMIFLTIILFLGQCANPEDGGTVDPIIPPDDPTLDTMYARVESRIRLEAIIDRSTFLFPKIPDSMRVSIIVFLNRSDTIPYREIYSASSLYLNLNSAVTLPFETVIPPTYFWKYNNSRLCIGYVIVFADRNKNKAFDYGETIYGVSEQAAFGYAYGKKLSNLPKDHFQDVLNGPNAMFRIGGDPYAIFQSAPDFDASVFKINIRGASQSFNVPYPWKPSMRLTP